MPLPNLTFWGIGQPAPTTLIASPPRPTVIFSKVAHLALEITAPRDWLSFLDYLVGGKSHSFSPTPSARNAPYAPAFSNLTHFDTDTSRRHGCFGSCAFLLADSDVSLLADTLPRLELLHLGRRCGRNTYRTTFRSLYSCLPSAVSISTPPPSSRTFYPLSRNRKDGQRPMDGIQNGTRG
jgi:hypothetical protein